MKKGFGLGAGQSWQAERAYIDLLLRLLLSRSDDMNIDNIVDHY